MNELGLFQATRPMKHRKDKHTDNTYKHKRQIQKQAHTQREKRQIEESISQSIRLDYLCQTK